MSEKRPNCIKCKYFYVTWDTRFPNGCKVYGIKTKYNPSVEVFRATGKRCVSFNEKQN